MKNILKDLLLFAFLVCVYFCGRLALLWLFNGNGEAVSRGWIFTSLRFDVMTATYIVLPTFAVSVVFLVLGWNFPRFKVCYATFAAFVSLLIAVVNVCFFFEYKSQFNYWIFGIFFDDFRAIAAAIWKTYPIVWISCLSIILAIGLYFFFKAVFSRIDRTNFEVRRLWQRFVVVVVSVFAVVLGLRGGTITGRPLQLRDAAVEPSEFLNNLIPSSAYCIKSEISKFWASATSDGLSRFHAEEADIPAFLRDLYGADCASLNAALARVSQGSPLKVAPKRIFLIVGEGHSAWPTYDRFQKYAIMPQTRALYDNSLHCRRALSSGGGTMASVSSLISGIPYTGLDVRGVYLAKADCAVAEILKRLGYSSTFFYAGQSTWMQLGEFAHFNGFERVVGGEAMGDLYGVVEWGVRDKDMFNYILKSDIPEKSFNMILTVSNHPPFDVDLRAEGCTAELKTENEVRLYHMWYADKQIGRFVKEIKKKYPDSVVIITGDHSARAVPDGEKMSDTEFACVPIIFAGNPIENAGLGGRESLQAQHLDIIPTIVEMLSPKGFKYNAWGRGLLEKSRPLPPMNPLCVEIDGEVYPFNSAKCKDSLRELARKYFALSYYYSNNK